MTCRASARGCPYLADLGVDAIWLSPFYPSPLLDGGYDVADPRDVDPRLGTVDDARAMVADAHALGLRVFVDVVPNHFSWEHRWFREALETAPGLPGVGSLPRRARPRRERRAAAEQLAQRVRRAGLDPGARPRRLVVPPPLRQLAARRQLGEPGDPRGLRGDPALLVRHGRRRLPHRRRALADQGGRLPRRPRAGGPHPAGRQRVAARRGTSRACTTSGASGAGSPTPTTRRARSSERRGSRRPRLRRRTPAPTSCTRPSTSTSSRPTGTRRSSAT